MHVIEAPKYCHANYTKYRERIENWMKVQRKKRIYELGSLPPFLLVFAGHVEPIHHRWNQHGLGGDNVRGSCRPLHPGPVSLLHWSGKGKPWVRLDIKKPCEVDSLWEPYDLFIRGKDHQRLGSRSGSSTTTTTTTSSDTLAGYSGYFLWWFFVSIFCYIVERFFHTLYRDWYLIEKGLVGGFFLGLILDFNSWGSNSLEQFLVDWFSFNVL